MKKDLGVLVEIGGRKYMTFLSNKSKDIFISNKIAAIDILKKYTDSDFTKKGVIHYTKVKDINFSILTIKFRQSGLGEELDCFVVHAHGNYTDLKPIFLRQAKTGEYLPSTKWQVKLDCGHLSIFDETVDKKFWNKIAKFPCFKCAKN